MMAPEQPSRVTPAEISDLLDQLRRLPADASPEERIAFCERKARLLTRIASTLDTPEAHQVAADAWHQVGQLARRLDAEEVRP